MDSYRDATGAAGAAKYMYQSSRVARGLSKSTRLTAAVDILKGGNLMDAKGMVDGTKGILSTTKGVNDAAKMSKFARVAGVAGKAAPFLTKASVVIGGAYGGYQVGSGINEIRNGNTQKGTDKIVSGTADLISSGAVAVAAASSSTIVGLPVAGVALGVAGVSQAAKYAYKYRGKIAQGAKWAGNKISQGFGALRNAFAD